MRSIADEDCRPVSDQWNVFKAHKNCIDIQAFFISAAAINAATDCAVYLWPIHYLMNVNMPLRQRLGLTICFSVGVMYVYVFVVFEDSSLICSSVCVASLLRVYYMTEFFKTWDQVRVQRSPPRSGPNDIADLVRSDHLHLPCLRNLPGHHLWLHCEYCTHVSSWCSY